MKKHLQIGAWRVSKGFIVFTAITLIWAALDIYSVATIPPFVGSIKAAKTYWYANTERNGERVGLYAISTVSEGGHTLYWHRDGTPYLSPPLREYVEEKAALEEDRVHQRKRYRFYFWMNGLSLPVQDIRFNIDGEQEAGLCSTESDVSGFRAGSPPYISGEMEVRYLTRAKKAAVSVAIASEKNQVILSEVPLQGRPGIQRGIKLSVLEQIPSEVYISPTWEKTNLGILVQLPANQMYTLDSDYSCKVYAADWFGRLHPVSVTYPARINGGYTVCLWTNLPARNVRAIYLAASPYHLFSFENLPLKPGKLSP